MRHLTNLSRCVGLLVLLIFGVATPRAHADADFWTTASTNFWTAGPWSLGHAPFPLDSANFNQTGNNYSALFDAATGDATIDELFVTGGNATFKTVSGPRRSLDVNGIGAFVVGGSLSLTNLILDVASEAEVGNAGTLNVSGGSLLSIGSRINLGIVGDNGTLVIDGTGSSVTAPAIYSSWAANGGKAMVAFRNDATGTFGGISMSPSSGDGTSAQLQVDSGADLTTGNLELAIVGGATTTATVDVQGSGSTVTQTGSSSLIVGHSATGTAALNIGTIGSGAMFTTGTGLATINKTGTIIVGGGLNSGTFNVNGDLTINGGVLVSSLFGGTFSLATNKTMTVQNGGRATFGGGYFTSSGAIYNVTGAGSKLETQLFNLNIASGAVVNVSAGGLISSGDTINVGVGSTGALAVGAGGSVTAVIALSVGSLGTLTGTGTITGNVQNTGLVSPGASPGTLTITGNYTQGATGTLNIGLASLASFDKLAVSGMATFAGTLDIDLIGFTPAAGDSFDIFDFASRSGSFTTLQLPALPDSLLWNINKLYTTGVLSVFGTFTSGDYNGNGVVDAADYVIWRDTLGSTTDLRANGDNSGASANVIDLADFTFWKTHFGVPPGSGSGANANVAAPEPATLMLLILGTVGVSTRLRCCASRVSKLINA